RIAKSWASTFPVFQRGMANSGLDLSFFASARMSPLWTPNWLSPAPHLALCFRVASLPSDLSCLRVPSRVAVVLFARAGAALALAAFFFVAFLTVVFIAIVHVSKVARPNSGEG